MNQESSSISLLTPARTTTATSWSTRTGVGVVFYFK